MITHIIGNLVKEPLDAFIHQCNCFNTMRSGVAKDVSETYPEVYEVDRKTKKGDPGKLGTFSFSKTSDGKIGYNLYSQFNFGYDGKRYTNYEAMRHGLEKIKVHIHETIKPDARVGIPVKMGCTRGGGDWNEVLSIINDIFENDTITIVLCEFKDYSTKQDDFTKKLREAYKKSDLLGSIDDKDPD